jgi:diaminohydroxyphosphoribosylaminopyrimidine deaminase / 5-amino-6-(5-phosphoribosylamino)uracil reductase
MTTHRWSPQDEAFMRMALSLAKGQLGKTGTNPAVGCVIVRDGKVIAQGVTQDGGRPHGEQDALDHAAGPVAGATVYVTLEPCAHMSERGPTCSNILIESEVYRVVACLEDPDPRTAGQGFARLRAAGIIVEIGLLRDEALSQVKGFIDRLRISH